MTTNQTRSRNGRKSKKRCHVFVDVRHNNDSVIYHSDMCLIEAYTAGTRSTAGEGRTATGIVRSDDVAWGRHRIEGTGIPIFSLVGQFMGGDSVALLADDFSLTPEQVEAAIRYALNHTDFDGADHLVDAESIKDVVALEDTPTEPAKGEGES